MKPRRDDLGCSSQFVASICHNKLYPVSVPTDIQRQQQQHNSNKNTKNNEQTGKRLFSENANEMKFV